MHTNNTHKQIFDSLDLDSDELYTLLFRLWPCSFSIIIIIIDSNKHLTAHIDFVIISLVKFCFLLLITLVGIEYTIDNRIEHV